MNRLQDKLEDAPPALRVLLTGAFAFVIGPMILGVMQLVLDGRVKAGPWDMATTAGEFALVTMALVSANLLMQKRSTWRRPLLIAGMVGCVLMLMGYSFAIGYFASHAGEMPKSAWQWFTVVFAFLVPIVAFVQAFRAYTRQFENDAS